MITIQQKQHALSHLGIASIVRGDKIEIIADKPPTEKEIEVAWKEVEQIMANPPKGEVEVLKERVAELVVEEDQLKDLLADVIEELLSD